MSGAVADVDGKITKRESQSRERVGDVIKMAMLKRGIQDEGLRSHRPSCNQSRETIGNEVSMVITARQSLQGTVLMDVGVIRRGGSQSNEERL